MPELLATIHDARVPGVNGRRMLAVLDEDKLRRVLARMLDEDEFLSPHGLRALSRVPRRAPVHVRRPRPDATRSRYLPAESDSGMFGGNSNWRGPVWFPVNYLVLRGLLHLYAYYGDDFTVECPTGSGRQCTLFEVAEELGRRLASIFVPDADGRRPVYGGTERFQTDPHWKDLLLFYEYFHGDNGAGLGASHQTGWTGLVARIIQVLGYLRPEDLLSTALKRQPRLPAPQPTMSERGWPADPVIYELNTAAWLHDVGSRAGATTTLADVPAGGVGPGDAAGRRRRVADGRVGAQPGRRPAGARVGRAGGVVPRRAARPRRRRRDRLGVLHPPLRGRRPLRRSRGPRRGPGRARPSVACGCSSTSCPTTSPPTTRWLTEHPEYFVQGTADDLAARSGGFLAVGDAVIARGRDPYFPPWPDVAQLNAFAPGLRQAAADTLIDIAEQADGVRCDMAMLLLNDVFARTWGERAGAVPEHEYWTEVIGAVRAAHPRLRVRRRGVLGPGVGPPAARLRLLLRQAALRPPDPRRTRRRFAATSTPTSTTSAAWCASSRTTTSRVPPPSSPPAQERAAAVAIATLPGATLWHEGQFEGWRVRLPVFLGRRPDEPIDEELRALPPRLIAAAADAAPRRLGAVRARPAGPRTAATTSSWPGRGPTTTSDRSSSINFADAPASARIHLPWDDLAGRTWRLDDLLAGEQFERDGTEMAAEGLYVQLAPWEFHVLDVEPAY